MKYLVGWDKFNGHCFHASLDWQKERGEKKGVKTGSIIYQYVQAITKLFNSITHPNETDAIALPILFLIKHGIELLMKNFILEAHAYHLRYVEELKGEDFKASLEKKQRAVSGLGHKLAGLLALLNEDFKQFGEEMQKKHGLDVSAWLQEMSIYGASEYDKESNYEVARKRVFANDGNSTINFFDLMSDFAELFNKVDPYDSAFKYQTSKKGAATLGGVDKVNIELLVCYFVEISGAHLEFREFLADFIDYDQWLDELGDDFGPEEDWAIVTSAD